jgi:hypothetical protein
MNDQLQNIPSSPRPPTQEQKTQHSGLKIFGIVVIACVISTLVALGAVYFYLFPGSFKPVTLSSREEQVLEQKLERLDSIQRSPVLHKQRKQKREEPTPGQAEGLQAERYSETDANREIILTERELNALLAKNTDLASKLAIDLSQDLASAKLLIPLDEDFPLLGGKTLKVTAGLELAYKAQKPVVALRGISLWGVPIPNAWLGNIKNVDLVQEFGDQKGFWAAFADGIDEVEVSEGQLRVRLKE